MRSKFGVGRLGGKKRSVVHYPDFNKLGMGDETVTAGPERVKK